MVHTPFVKYHLFFITQSLTLPASLPCLQSPNKTISYNPDKINRCSRLFARFSEIVQISVRLLDIFLTRHRNFFPLFLQKRTPVVACCPVPRVFSLKGKYLCVQKSAGYLVIVCFSCHGSRSFFQSCFHSGKGPAAVAAVRSVRWCPKERLLRPAPASGSAAGPCRSSALPVCKRSAR